VANVAGGGGGGVSAWLDVREDGRRGARSRGEEGEGEVVVVVVSPALTGVSGTAGRRYTTTNSTLQPIELVEMSIHRA